MKKLQLLIFCILAAYSQILAQGGVGINNDNSAPNASAMLDIKATDKGLLIPRMTQAQRNGITSPATGLLIFQTDNTPGFYYYDGSTWTAVAPAGGASQWTANGNDIYNANIGNVGVGTNTPSNAKLQVRGSGGNASVQTIEYRGYVYDDFGSFTGASDGSFGTASIVIPTDVANNASSVSLAVNIGGNVTGSPGFGFPLNLSVDLQGNNIATGLNSAGPDGCGDPNNGGTYLPTTVTATDVTALVSGQTTLNLRAEDYGGAGGNGMTYCGFTGIWVEYVLTYSVPIPEPALAVENGTIQLTDLAGNGNIPFYMDNQGDLQMVTGSGPLLVKNPDGTITMQNYIEQSITIGNKPWDVTNPTYLNGYDQAILEVRGGTQRPLYGGNIREYDSTGTNNSNPFVPRVHSNGHINILDNFGIHADFNIAGGNFFAHSDARIKNILGKSNSNTDLALLKTIEVTNYKYIDTLAKGNRITKKVIAQDLHSIYPEAVTLTSRVIPSIYQYADIQNGWIDIAPKDLKIGEPLEYYTTKNGKETRHTTVVVAVENNRFRVANQVEESNAFIYGKMVNDFHVVDYDALTTLNISATQELLKRIEALEKENAALKSQNQELQTLKAEVAEIKSLLKSTSSNK